jgi:hypothetical protein
MTLRYAVGIKIGNRADQMTVEAADALIAALKVKTATPKLRSPTCASETPAAIDAIRIPARSMRIRPGKRQVMHLGRGHLSRRSTAPSRRPCPTPCPSLRPGPQLNPS